MKYLTAFKLMAILLFIIISHATAGSTPFKYFQDSTGIELTWPVRKIHINKTGCLDEIISRGTRITGASLPDLVCIDKDGELYRQSNSNKGSIDINDTGGHLIIKVDFEMQSDWGSIKIPSTIEYDIRKMDGYTEVTYTLKPDDKIFIRKLEIIHDFTRPQKLNMDILYAGYKWRANYIKAVPGEVKKHKEGALDYLMFTNGELGLQLLSITYSGIAAYDNMEKLWVAQTLKDRHRARLVCINYPKGKEILLPKNYKIRYAMALFPLQDYVPNINGLLGENDPIEAARQGSNLVNYTATGIAGYYVPQEWSSQGPEWYRNYLSDLHKYGILMLAHVDAGWNQTRLISQTPEKEARELAVKTGEGFVEPYGNNLKLLDRDRVKSPILFDGNETSRIQFPGDPNDPAPAWYGWGLALMCINGKTWQNVLYPQIETLVNEYGVDGIYLDSSEIFPCHNTAHGCDKDYTLTTYGLSRFSEKIRNILNLKQAIDEKKKYFVAHVQDRYAASAIGLSDFTFPGEELVTEKGQSITNLLEQSLKLRTTYNSRFSGIQCVYLKGPADPMFYVTAISRCALINPINEPKHLELWEKYMAPLKIFDITGSKVIHYQDKDFSKLINVKPNNSKVPVVIYEKNDKALVIVTNEGGLSGKVKLTFDAGVLGLKGNTVVFDINTNEIIEQDDSRHLVLETNFSSEPEAHMWVVSQQTDQPQVIWHDIHTWDTKIIDGNSVEIKGVPLEGQEGYIIIYDPVNKIINKSNYKFDKDGKALVKL